MLSISTFTFTSDRITIDYDTDSRLFTMKIGADNRIIMSLADARDLYHEIDTALRHAYDEAAS